MAGYDGSIRIDTKIDKKGFNNGLNSLTGSVKKFMGLIATAFSVTAVVKFGKACVDVATETSNAWIGLNSILTGQGKSFDIAKSFINDYVSDGLIPLNNAVAAYKNLALRGYSSDQIQKTMNALKNSATFARQSTYSLGDAVQTATEGIKNENSMVVDNAGVTKNVAKMWEDYAKSIGKTTNNLTQAEKIQAEVNGILEETKFQSNDAAIYSSTYAGKLAQLNSAFTTMKTAIGNAIQPIAKLFVPVITSAVNVVTKLFTALAGLLSLFGLKADSVETVSNGIGDLAEEAGQASDAIEGIGDSAAQAGKDAKKASKDVTSFDKLNTLSSNKNTSSVGSGDSGSAGTSGIKESLDLTTTLQEDTSMFDGLIGRVKELLDLFKQGFDVSFGETNFDGIIGHLKGIKDLAVEIWTDPEVTGATNQWIEAVMYRLGQTVGAIARIGTNIVEGLIGSIEKYVKQNKERMKKHIVSMFKISSEDLKLTGNLWEVLGKISDVFKSAVAKQIGADLIAIFLNPLMSIQEFFAKFTKDIKAIFFQPIIDNAEKLKVTFENIIKPIRTITSTLAEAFTYVGDKWNEVYDGHIKPLMDSIKTGLRDTFGKFLDVYNTYVAPALQRMADKFQELWNTHLKPLVDNISGFIGSIGDALTVFWNNILKPIVDWIVQNILPILVPILETIWNTACNVFGLISNAISHIIGVIKGIIDFIVGIFTGDWEKAWNAVKGIFSTIWDGIKNMFAGIGNTLKDIFKGVIEWIKAGLSSWGNTISEIWNKIWDGIKNAFSNIVNGIKNIASNIFNGIKNTISNILTGIKNTWNNIWNGLKTTVTNVFNSIWSTIKKVINSILGGIERMTNGVINGINGMIGALNKLKFDVPDWVPLIGGKKFGFNIPNMKQVSIPRLAKGGIAYRPTYAQIAEAGKEAVLPLENNTGWMDTLADKLVEKIGIKKSDNGDIVIYIVVDGEIIQKVVQKRQKKDNFATNGGI